MLLDLLHVSAFVVQVIQIVEVRIRGLDPVLEVRVLLVVPNACGTLSVNCGDRGVSDVCAPRHDLGLGHGQQVIGVLELVLEQQTLLAARELAFGNEIQVLGEYVLAVVQVARSDAVQVLQIVVDEGL